MQRELHSTWLARNWKWVVPSLCLAFLVIVGSFMGLVFYGVTNMMKSTDAYQMAIRQASSNPDVVAAIGTPIKEGFFITGSMSSNDASGSAEFAIPISGPDGEATIYVAATKSIGEWTFRDLVVEIEKTNDRIDLLHTNKTD